MSTAELMLWSAASGAMALIALATFLDLFVSRTRAAQETFLYIGLCAVRLCSIPAWRCGCEASSIAGSTIKASMSFERSTRKPGDTLPM